MPSAHRGSLRGPPGNRKDHTAPCSPYSARLSVRHAACVNLPERVGIGGADRRGDTATDIPHGDHAHLPGLEGRDEVVQDAVGDVFVEVAFFAKAPQVELEALQLDNLRARNVADSERREIRLAGHRTHTRELGAHALDFVITIRVWV